MIRIGQQLLIPSSSRGADAYALSQSQRLQRTQSRERDGNKVSSTVRRGDTFWDIAREHRVSVREVAAWNGMAPGDPLIPGKKLVIWSKTAQPTVASANPARNQADRKSTRLNSSHVRISYAVFCLKKKKKKKTQ